MAKRKPRKLNTDVIQEEVRLLDVGPDMYGDCIFCRIGGKTVLIDGAHQGDDIATDFDNITQQLSSLLGPPPFFIDLLIVTHGHIDHTGCLPSLVQAGKLNVKDALVADPEMGWGRPEGIDAPLSRVDRIAMALREEPFLSDNSAQVAEFIDAAGGLFNRYVSMLGQLESAGTKVVRYRRDQSVRIRALVKKYRSSTGLILLGPSFDHLETCNEFIKRKSRDSLDEIRGMDRADAEVEVYLTMARSLDAGKVSAAINNQSIVLAIGNNPNRVLLTGDMQFGDPEVRGLEDGVQQLIANIKQNAPYAMVKLAHHGSANATSEELLEAVGPTSFFAISTGSKSDKHPYLSTLDLLRAHEERIGKRVRWGRTDRNGWILLRLTPPMQASTQRGDWNDYTPPMDFDAIARAPKPVAIAPVIPMPVTPVRVEPVFPNAPTSDVVEIHAKIPHVHTRVTFTVEVEPLASGAASKQRSNAVASLANPRAPDGPPLHDLLVLTDAKRLASVTTTDAAEAAIAALQRRGAQIRSDFPSTAPEQARLAFSRSALAQFSSKGLLILGGYDVVPPIAVDALDEELRETLGPTNDPDDFIVWSDDPYADADESAVPDVPISRLPDGGSAEFLTAQIGSSSDINGRAYILRNHFRPFADSVLEGESYDIDVSHPHDSERLNLQRLNSPRLYFMLHGDDVDGTRFWGERPGGGALEAIRTSQIHDLERGSVVLAGCCWGALVGDRPAIRCASGEIPKGRTVQQSMALSFLAAGAKAFIGCTGAHYSPLDPPYDYFGGPLHSDFWKMLSSSGSPAVALFQAKQNYLEAFPHNRDRPLEQAIERKILRQFTCLGIGW